MSEHCVVASRSYPGFCVVRESDAVVANSTLHRGAVNAQSRGERPVGLEHRITLLGRELRHVRLTLDHSS